MFWKKKSASGYFCLTFISFLLTGFSAVFCSIWKSDFDDTRQHSVRADIAFFQMDISFANTILDWHRQISTFISSLILCLLRLKSSWLEPEPRPLYSDCHSDLPRWMGSQAAARACPWLQRSPSPCWEAFSLWYANQCLPFSKENGQIVLFVFQKQQRWREDAKRCRFRWASAHICFQTRGGWGGQLFSPLWGRQAMLM